MAHKNSRGTALGGHHTPRQSTDTVWLTPPAILRALGPFQLDPCACPAPRPWPTALAMWTLPLRDGLTEEWTGRVFCNPPYDENLDRWLEKCSVHQNCIALTFARTETQAWQRIVWPLADSILFIAGRLDFYLPDGSRAKNAGGPSALISFNRENTFALEDSGISGKLVSLWNTVVTRRRPKLNPCPDCVNGYCDMNCGPAAPGRATK